jgi:hypothetical protein
LQTSPNQKLKPAPACHALPSGIQPSLLVTPEVFKAAGPKQKGSGGASAGQSKGQDTLGNDENLTVCVGIAQTRKRSGHFIECYLIGDEPFHVELPRAQKG